MDKKQIAIAIGAVAVIVIGIVVVMKMMGNPAPPPSVLAAKATLVAVKPPCAVKEITVAERSKLSLDSATGYYKIGNELYANPIDCYSCKEKVPELVVKPNAEKPGMLLSGYKCPKCGKPAYPPQ